MTAVCWMGTSALSVTVPVPAATAKTSAPAVPLTISVSLPPPPAIVSEPVAPSPWYVSGTRLSTCTEPESTVAPGVTVIVSAPAVPVTVRLSLPPWPLMVTYSTVAKAMETGPAPVIVPASAAVGVKSMLSWPGVPLAISVSPVVGSPPLMVMPVSPVGVFGLLRLNWSLPARPLIDQRGLIGEVDRLLIVHADFAPGRVQHARIGRVVGKVVGTFGEVDGIGGIGAVDRQRRAGTLSKVGDTSKKFTVWTLPLLSVTTDLPLPASGPTL